MTEPLSTASKPITVRISVVLPAPLRPARPTIWPWRTCRFTWRRMLVGPIRTSRFLTSSSIIGLLFIASHRLADDVFTDLLMGQHFVWRAVGQNGAVVESQHTIAVATHDFHIVLHKQNRHARITDHFHDTVHHFKFLVTGHATGGLVQQQH